MKFSALVASRRTKLKLTKRELAQLAAIDASYVTSIEQDKFVPSRKTVAAIGRALKYEDGALVVCGFLPPALRSWALLGLKLGNKRKEVAQLAKGLCQ